MAAYTTVLFDLDGTLIDSVRLILDSYHHTLAAHGLPPRSDAYWLQGIGTPLRVQFREFAEDPALLERLVATYRDYNIAHHDTRVVVYPGVLDMMTAVRQRGIRTGLVTSKNREGAMRGLRLVGLLERFEIVVAADDVQHPKPHPEPVLRAIDALGARAHEALFVGDSRHDMESGRAAGVRTGAVLWGPFDREHLAPSGPDHWFETPEDLVRLVA